MGALMNVQESVKPTWSIISVTAINLVAIGGLLVVSLLLIVHPFVPVFSGRPNPFAFLGAIVVTPVFALVWIVAYASVLRRLWAAGTMPVLYTLAAVFCLFGVAVNIVEAMMSENGPDWGFVVEFGLVGTTITVYFCLCSFLAIRWWRRLRRASRVPVGGTSLVRET